MKEKLSKEFLSQLMPFQYEGVKQSLDLNGKVLIGDEMGLGKTIQALAIAKW